MPLVDVCGVCVCVRARAGKAMVAFIFMILGGSFCMFLFMLGRDMRHSLEYFIQTKRLRKQRKEDADFGGGVEMITESSYTDNPMGGARPRFTTASSGAVDRRGRVATGQDESMKISGGNSSLSHLTAPPLPGDRAGASAQTTSAPVQQERWTLVTPAEGGERPYFYEAVGGLSVWELPAGATCS